MATRKKAITVAQEEVPFEGGKKFRVPLTLVIDSDAREDGEWEDGDDIEDLEYCVRIEELGTSVYINHNEVLELVDPDVRAERLRKKIVALHEELKALESEVTK